MTVTTEKLLAYVDGELSPDEMKIVQAALAADPELRRELETQRALTHSLQSAFDRVLDEPIPGRLSEAVRSRDPGRSWHHRVTEALRETFAVRPLFSGAAAASAALALGLAAGVFVAQPDGGDFAADPQGLMARAELAKTLDRQLASDQDPNAARKIGVTFRNGNGEYCRTFNVPGSAGVACREPAGWHVLALAATQSSRPQSQYRMAGADMPDAIRDAVTAMMAGPALNAEAEKRARDRGWVAGN